ncbi:MAG: tRNA (adenosine(37)-N6)-threonylcarbamoyltransferase complex transferase subunit TsaD [Veillonellaceae bacterium]|nr:tRNA (adenosine(37)-N6)-threonylcarbamoyltransferase complex transferase subunit TsaD [Veillonellaceae bacterium]
MKILALETSCDETSAAVVEDGRHVLADTIATQVEVHRKFGGVVPEIASRHHIRDVLPVVMAALDEAGTTLQEVDAVAVTQGPGLVGALLVGVATAKALAYAAGKPLVAVHHMEGHMYANLVAHPELEPPFLTLVVSGGHTLLVDVPAYNECRVLGQTKDDAAGEAFDKIARVMGYPYPGGPEIDRLAKTGNPHAVEFPLGLHKEDSYDFSFSGLKSAVINYLHNCEQKGESYSHADVAASFQRAVVDILVEKTRRAAAELGRTTVCLAGGVAANSALREALAAACLADGRTLLYPPLRLCTDNAVMIGARAYYQYLAGDVAGQDLNADPRLPFTGTV